MPTDTRRINGPESSISPYAFVKSKQLTDKTGLITQAQGSSYIEQDGTKVICAVYGPRAVIKREEFSMQGQMTCEFKFAPFSCRQRRQHMQDAEEKDYSVQLLEALEPAVLLHKFPKAQVNIYITVLQNDGTLAASMTCASMALADAGIEMYDLVTGCSARIKGDTILMDPCSSEEYSDKDSATVNNGSVTVGIMPSLNQISAAIRQCVDVCIQLYPVCQQSLTSAVEDLIQKGSDT
ncbi:EXOS6-like protein [Mya arenaria]|uniref:EXOS6-like protein n=1 Tax=Mya arenaria TaxID=6604 RepID=A0ABY7ES26_MYAAR|nr:EXOS6-like protein [Mya arenaria]WAR11832.1 EXOS6-like protein [Mya arenaria]